MFLTLYYIFFTFSHLLQVNRGQDYEGKPKEVHIHATAEYGSHSSQVLYPLEIQEPKHSMIPFPFNM